MDSGEPVKCNCLVNILQGSTTITITDLIGVDTQIPTVTTATSPSLVGTTFMTSQLVVEEEGDLHLQYVYFKIVVLSDCGRSFAN